MESRRKWKLAALVAMIGVGACDQVDPSTAALAPSPMPSAATVATPVAIGTIEVLFKTPTGWQSHGAHPVGTRPSGSPRPVTPTADLVSSVWKDEAALTMASLTMSDGTVLGFSQPMPSARNPLVENQIATRNGALWWMRSIRRLPSGRASGSITFYGTGGSPEKVIRFEDVDVTAGPPGKVRQPSAPPVFDVGTATFEDPGGGGGTPIYEEGDEWSHEDNTCSVICNIAATSASMAAYWTARLENLRTSCSEYPFDWDACAEIPTASEHLAYWGPTAARDLASCGSCMAKKVVQSVWGGIKVALQSGLTGLLTPPLTGGTVMCDVRITYYVSSGEVTNVEVLGCYKTFN